MQKIPIEYTDNNNNNNNNNKGIPNIPPIHIPAAFPWSDTNKDIKALF